MRLDEILTARGLADKEQIQEALDYQKEFGGRLESHLYRFGYVNESGLVGALAEQFGCDGVTLNGRDIPAKILNLIPPSLARTRLLMPFDHDPDSGLVKIACENPADEGLVSTLEAAVPGAHIRLYVALGTVLKCVIVKFYRKAMLDIPDSSIRQEDTKDIDTAADPAPSPQSDLLNATASKIKDIVQSQGKAFRVLILKDPETNLQALKGRLAVKGYTAVVTENLAELSRLYQQRPPDIMLLIKVGSAESMSDLIYELANHGVMVRQTPTFLLPLDDIADQLTGTLEDGIEDVLHFDDNIDPLLIKMGRVRQRVRAESTSRLKVIQNLGTFGSLEDMNMVDLLQTMGPSRKTARLSITGHGKHLAIYLDQGNIIWAECNDKVGAEAIYEGMTWTRGIWNIDPASREELPEPNNHLPNESILLEGCRIMDELNREKCPN